MRHLTALQCDFQNKGPEEAIKEVEKLGILEKDHLYQTLLGTLFRSGDIKKVWLSFEKALELAKTASDKKILKQFI